MLGQHVSSKHCGQASYICNTGLLIDSYLIFIILSTEPSRIHNSKSRSKLLLDLILKFSKKVFNQNKLHAQFLFQIEDKFNEIIQKILDGGEEKFDLDRMHTLSKN